jgi:hypothetical protein
MPNWTQFILQISDRMGGRRRIFVEVSSIVMAASALGMVFTKSFGVCLIVAVFFGIGYGVFIAVDFGALLSVCISVGPLKELLEGSAHPLSNLSPPSHGPRHSPQRSGQGQGPCRLASGSRIAAAHCHPHRCV